MKKATVRPTAATRQAAQAKADRRAAALERRQGDYRQDAGFQTIYQHHTMNKQPKTYTCHIERRLHGRLEVLKQLGVENPERDVDVLICRALLKKYTVEYLASKKQGQTAVMRKTASLINEAFDGMKTISLDRLGADDKKVNSKIWSTTLVPAADLTAVQQIIEANI